VSTYRERAVGTLSHYIKLLFQKQGLNWDKDNDAEIDYIVDCIMKASVNETLRILDEQKPKVKVIEP
jgi:hypothetical protein